MFQYLSSSSKQTFVSLRTRKSLICFKPVFSSSPSRTSAEHWATHFRAACGTTCYVTSTFNAKRSRLDGSLPWFGVSWDVNNVPTAKEFVWKLQIWTVDQWTQPSSTSTAECINLGSNLIILRCTNPWKRLRTVEPFWRYDQRVGYLPS